MTTGVEHNLHRQTRKASSLVDQIRETIGDDDELLQDMIEGETDLLPVLQKAADQIDEDQILIDGINARISDLETRKAQTQARIERIRAMIEQAVMLSGEKAFRLPSMTISLRQVPRKPIVTDEALIPASFWQAPKPQPPKLDKKLLADALKDGAGVPGAELDNGGFALSIRRK